MNIQQRRCPLCRDWMPITALVCGTCGEPVAPAVAPRQRTTRLFDAALHAFAVLVLGALMLGGAYFLVSR